MTDNAELLRRMRSARRRLPEGAVEYWRDFVDLGVAHLLDAVVTSLEVGFRKPHPSVFEAALGEAGCAPAACVMVGNSEQNDIQPAVALGMRAIRVAIDEPPATSSAADAIVTDLDAVLDTISRGCEPAESWA